MKYKYSVVTAIFNNYEKVHEVQNPVKDVEYVLVTDDNNLTSSTWKVKVFDKYDKIDFPELNWLYVKFFPLDFCESNTCLFIDGTVQISNDFSELISYLENNDYEYAIPIDIPWVNIEHWIEGPPAFQSKDTKNHILEYLTDNNYDIYARGICNTAFVYRKRTHFTNKIDTFAWNLLKSYDRGAEGYRENQSALTISLRKNAYQDRRFKLLSQFILIGSPWFVWTNHGNRSVRDLGGFAGCYARYLSLNSVTCFNDKLCKPLTYLDITENKPLLTVVITCYNKENTIKRAIDSVKRMSYSNWECVIVNNDSLDNSLNIIYENTNGDDRFKVVSQTNKNLCNSRNVGAFLGNGKYLVHLDGDDEIGKYFCEQSINAMEHDENLCIATGLIKRHYLNDWSNYIISGAAYVRETGDTEINDRTIDLILHCNPFPVTSVIKMDRFKAIGGFREGAEYTVEDWDMFLRYMCYDTNILGVYYSYEDVSVDMYETVNSKSKEQTVNWGNNDKMAAEVRELNLNIFEKYGL